MALDPGIPAEAQRIVAAYLAVVDAHTSADVYPGLLRDLPTPSRQSNLRSKRLSWR